MNCPQCGNWNSEKAFFCRSCGCQLVEGELINCPVCGAWTDAKATYCRSCHRDMASPRQAPSIQYSTYTQQAPQLKYAGFWVRGMAWFIDNTILTVVTLPVYFILLFPTLKTIFSGTGNTYTGTTGPLSHCGGIFFVLLPIGGWFYYVLMESSKYQGTPGKIIMGIKVTDLKGNRIGWEQASGRFFGKMVSNMILMIGFVMAAYTPKRQALHDILSGCLVVMSKTNSNK